MRTEKINGRWLLCGCILPKDKIKPGQVWAQADGTDRIVRIAGVRTGWVCYTWADGGPLQYSEKEAFAFQCRYCLVLESPEIPKELLPKEALPENLDPDDALVTKCTTWLSQVNYPGYTFTVRKGHGGVFLQATYFDADVYTLTRELQYTRKWLLSPQMTNSEVVQTAFKCALTSAEHRVREWFTYKDKAIFGPHFDVDDLARLEQKGGRP